MNAIVPLNASVWIRNGSSNCASVSKKGRNRPSRVLQIFREKPAKYDLTKSGSRLCASKDSFAAILWFKESRQSRWSNYLRARHEVPAVCTSRSFWSETAHLMNSILIRVIYSVGWSTVLSTFGRIHSTGSIGCCINSKFVVADQTCFRRRLLNPRRSWTIGSYSRSVWSAPSHQNTNRKKNAWSFVSHATSTFPDHHDKVNELFWRRWIRTVCSPRYLAISRLLLCCTILTETFERQNVRLE